MDGGGGGGGGGQTGTERDEEKRKGVCMFAYMCVHYINIYI